MALGSVRWVLAFTHERIGEVQAAHENLGLRVGGQKVVPGVVVGDGFAGGHPGERGAVEAPDEGGIVNGEIVVLVIDGDLRVFPRLGDEAERHALLVLALGAAKLALAIEEAVEAKREPVGDQRLIVIQRRAVRVPAVTLERELRGGLAELGALGGGDDRTLGVADADQECVGPERKGDALGVVDIGRAVEGEEVVGEAQVAGHIAHEAADGNRLAVAGPQRDAAVAGIAVVEIHAGGVFQGLVEGGDTEVLEKLRGEDGEGGADILEVCAQARARERFGGGITGARLFVQDERGEFDDGLASGRLRWAGAFRRHLSRGGVGGAGANGIGRGGSGLREVGRDKAGEEGGADGQSTTGL